jgi:TnpA family transposase
LLGFRFAPRIRDLKEKRLYILPGMTVPPELASLVAGAITDQQAVNADPTGVQVVQYDLH